MRLINLTPHPVVIHLPAGEPLTLPPEPVSARCEQRSTSGGLLGLSDAGRYVPVSVETFGAVTGLPAPCGHCSTESGSTPRAARCEVCGVDDETLYHCEYCTRDVCDDCSTRQTSFVVSRLVADAAAREGRNTADLFVPGPAVRDDSGRVVGCWGLSRIPAPVASPVPVALELLSSIRRDFLLDPVPGLAEALALVEAALRGEETR